MVVALDRYTGTGGPIRSFPSWTYGWRHFTALRGQGSGMPATIIETAREKTKDRGGLESSGRSRGDFRLFLWWRLVGW